METLYKLGGMATKVLLSPFEEIGTNAGLSEKNFIAFLESRNLSELLKYRYYETIEDRDDLGIYTMSDGRKGFIFRVFPNAFIGEKFEEQMQSFIESIDLNGTVLNFSTFSSQNYENQIEEFVALHPCDVNVRNVDALKEIVQARADYLRKWSRSSISKGGVDLRFKDLVNTVSVLLPEEITTTEEAAEYYDQFRSALGDIPSIDFSAADLITLLREFFHNEKGADYWKGSEDPFLDLNFQIAGGNLKVEADRKDFKEGYVINNSNYVTVLTTQQFPTQIDVTDFKECFFDMMGKTAQPTISGPFVASLTVLIEDVERIKDHTMSKLTHDLSEMRRMPMKTIDARPEIRDRLQETREQMRNIKLEGETPMRSMLSIVVFDLDKRRQRKSVSSLKNRFLTKGWKLVEESFGNISVLETLFSFPLEYDKRAANLLQRFKVLFKSNNASIIPLFSDARGFGRKHMPLFGRTGQIQWFDPMASDSSYNIAATGWSGSGKSFTFSDFAVLSVAMNGKGRIIDSLPSYKRTTELIGGDYIDFDDNNQICLNFFTNILTKKDGEGNPIYSMGEDGQKYEIIMEEEIATIIPIIGMMCGVNLSAGSSESANDINTTTLTKYLSATMEEAIVASFRSRGRAAGLEEVYNYLREVLDNELKLKNSTHSDVLHSVIKSLEPFSKKDGSFYSYFNGVNNLNIELDFMTFELTRLENKGVLYPIVMMSIANQIINEFFSDMDRFKFLMIDEFWKFKGMKIVMNFVVELARKVRKANGILITITQQITDYFDNEQVEAVYQNSNWKMMLKQPASSLDQASQSKKISVGIMMLQLLKSIYKRELFGEFAIMTEGAFMISRLKVDPTSEWMYSTNPKHRERITIVSKQYSISEVEAAKFCAFQSEHPDATENDIMQGIGLLGKHEKEEIEKKKKMRYDFVKNRIAQSIKMKNPAIFKQHIVDGDEKVVGHEITAQIRGEGNEMIPPVEWIPIAIEENMIRDIDMLVWEKSMVLYASENLRFHVNISIDALLDPHTVDWIIPKARENNCIENMYVEIPLRDATKEQILQLRKQVERLRSAGIKVGNDSVGLDMSIDAVISMPLDFLKINALTSLKLDDKNEAVMFTRLLIPFAESNGYDINFVNVYNEESFIQAKNMGGEFFQGQYFHERERIS